MDYNMDQIEKMLSDNDYFRINRGALVRIDAIDNIAVHSNSRLKLQIGDADLNDTLVVAREKVNAFKAWLER